MFDRKVFKNLFLNFRNDYFTYFSSFRPILAPGNKCIQLCLCSWNYGLYITIATIAYPPGKIIF